MCLSRIYAPRVVSSEDAPDGDDDDGDNNPGPDADDDAAAGEAAAGARARADPQTKKEFDSLREDYKNSWAMCADFLQDKDLQKRLRILVISLGPLESEFFRDVAEQKGGQLQLARWAARRAAGESPVVTETFQLLHDPDVFERLGMFRGTQADVLPEEPWVQEEMALCDMLFNMIVEVAAARAWSQAMFRVMLPQLCAGLLHENQETAQRLCNFMRQVSEAVLEAENVVGNRTLAACLSDMAWHKTQAARELMKMGQERVQVDECKPTH